MSFKKKKKKQLLVITHAMGFEPMTSPSTLLLEGDKFPFELELIGAYVVSMYMDVMKRKC